MYHWGDLREACQRWDHLWPFVLGSHAGASLEPWGWCLTSVLRKSECEARLLRASTSERWRRLWVMGLGVGDKPSFWQYPELQAAPRRTAPLASSSAILQQSLVSFPSKLSLQFVLWLWPTLKRRAPRLTLTLLFLSLPQPFWSSALNKIQLI